MIALIPLADARAVGARHGTDYGLIGDPSTEWARRTAWNFRRAASVGDPLGLLAEADDLDALADRYERNSA